MLIPTMTYQEILKEVSLDVKELNKRAEEIIDRKISSKYSLFKETYRRNGNMPFQLKENKNSVIIKTSRGNSWSLIVSDISIQRKNDYQYSLIKYIILNKKNGGREVLCPCIITNPMINLGLLHTSILSFEAHLFRRFKERYILKQNPSLKESDTSFEKIVNVFFTVNEDFPFYNYAKDFDKDGNVKTLIVRAKTQTGILLGDADRSGRIRYKTFITEEMLKDFQADLKPGSELDQMLNKKILNLYE